MRLWLTGELQININPKMISIEIIVFIIIVLTLISENELMEIVFIDLFRQPFFFFFFFLQNNT